MTAAIRRVRAAAGSGRRPARRRGASGVVPACVLAAALALASPVGAQERGPVGLAPEALQAAIDRLGDLDYDMRMNAARAIRRAPAPQAVPALVAAFGSHGDGYVRFKALVLLSGYSDPRAHDAMVQALDSPHDRLREAAYRYFELNPDPALLPRLLAALETEHGEFVRPALVRALAVHRGVAAVREALVRDVGRGVDYFRSAVIEALGDYRWAEAVEAIAKVAELEGPLQDDAALALGMIGDRRALETLARLQRTAPRETQPAIAAAICLLGSNCSAHLGFLRRTLEFAETYPGHQELLRNAAAGLGALAVGGHAEALRILLEIGIPSQDPVRAPIALAVARVALRRTPLLLAELESHRERDRAIDLLAEGFDMLEEDVEEERFFVAVRRAYWEAPEGSAVRALCERLITVLHF